MTQELIERVKRKVLSRLDSRPGISYFDLLDPVTELSLLFVEDEVTVEVTDWGVKSAIGITGGEAEIRRWCETKNAERNISEANNFQGS